MLCFLAVETDDSESSLMVLTQDPVDRNLPGTNDHKYLEACLLLPMLDGNPMRTVLLMMITIIDVIVDVLNENYRSNGS